MTGIPEKKHSDILVCLMLYFCEDESLFLCRVDYAFFLLRSLLASRMRDA